jgi:hypothetical protein
MPSSHSGPAYGLLAFGVISFLLAAMATCTGEAWGRFGRVVYRAKEPTQFWGLVVLQYVVAVCFIGYFLYKAFEHSH